MGYPLVCCCAILTLKTTCKECNNPAHNNGQEFWCASPPFDNSDNFVGCLENEGCCGCVWQPIWEDQRDYNPDDTPEALEQV